MMDILYKYYIIVYKKKLKKNDDEEGRGSSWRSDSQ